MSKGKKELKVTVKIQIKGLEANPATVGSALGPHGINLADFCRKFNEQTSDKKGEVVPVVISIYTDRTFDFILKTPPVSALIKKILHIEKGSSNAKEQKVGKITSADLESIAKVKMVDLNAYTVEEAKKIIAGSARSMGVDVVD